MTASFVSYWVLDGPGGIEGDVIATLVWVLLAALVTTLVYPPLRRGVESFVKRHVALGNVELHEKLDHVIFFHPDIPPFQAHSQYDDPVSDDATQWPTPAEVSAAGLVVVTTWEEIDAALANGQGPLRTANAKNKNFPPVTTGYVTKPKVTPPPPPSTTFTASQTGPNEVTVDWSGFSPTEIERDGTDTNGGGPWNTGTLTGQPTSGSFKFEYLVPGDTYVFTITGPNVSMTASVKMTAPSLPTLGMNGSTDAASLAQMQSLGVKLVRVQVTWNYYDEWDAMNGTPFYNADGSFNASIAEQANAIKTLCASYGITVLFLIDGFISSAPTVPAGAGNYTPGLPHSPAAYAEACAWFCSQVKGAHIEGPNEPNGYAQWNGSVPFLASRLRDCDAAGLRAVQGRRSDLLRSHRPRVGRESDEPHLARGPRESVADVRGVHRL